MSAVQGSDLIVRPMTGADVKAIMQVERASYQFPWSEAIFRDCLRVGYLCRVLERGDVLEGYGVLSFGAGEAHVLNICIRPESRGRGLGRALLQRLIADARVLEAQRLLLEVRPSNTAAVHLYESLGFVQTGRRRDYYPAVGGREDALLFELTL